MAKISGPIASAMRGKVGQVVAAKTVGGDTALRAYQPVVKNPNTLRQQAARNRFSFVSGLCAILAPALELGFARAASSAKMYPRNMALRSFINDNHLISQSKADVITVDPMALFLSKKDGISEKPQVTYTAPANGRQGSLTCTNGGNVVLHDATAKVGVVYVVAMVNENGTGSVLAIKQALHNAPVTVTEAEAAMWTGATIYAFFKAVPETGTIVATTDVPWKYPSETGETAVVQTIN